MSEDRVTAAAARIGAAGRVAWPTVQLSDEAIAANLSQRVADDAETQLDDLKDADLYLAIALTGKDPAAVKAFETQLVPQIDVALLAHAAAGKWAADAGWWYRILGVPVAEATLCKLVDPKGTAAEKKMARAWWPSIIRHLELRSQSSMRFNRFAGESSRSKPSFSRTFARGFVKKRRNCSQRRARWRLWTRFVRWRKPRRVEIMSARLCTTATRSKSEQVVTRSSKPF